MKETEMHLKTLYHTNVSNGIVAPGEEEEAMDEKNFHGNPFMGSRPQQDKKTKTAGGSKTPYLDQFGTDLTLAVANHQTDPVVGREEEITRVIEILGRRKKNNPILIGEPGVGKSAIVEGLAQKIVQDAPSSFMAGKRIISLNLTQMVSGTQLRGQFEERAVGVLKELEQHPEIIIFIDEIHTLVGAGDGAGAMDAANIFKPALARGTIQCIGATTLDEYRKSIEKDGALERRFQKVMVNATSPEDTLRILHHIKDVYEQHHCVDYTDDALQACVDLTERYVTNRQFPDKAIDVLDEVGAHAHIANTSIPKPIVQLQQRMQTYQEKKQQAVSSQNYELAAEFRDHIIAANAEMERLRSEWKKGNLQDRTLVREEDVADVVSRMTGIPVQRMVESEYRKMQQMPAILKEKVIGQDKAVDKIVKAIQRNRLGLREANRPIGTFMFLGPTGVGKTYMAKKLAELMFGSADALIRVDMSEYSESFNTSRLIGAPPGYVGYDEGGQLTEQVRRKPYSIVLLDEIEKANDKVFNLLLQVLDEGRLSDGNGRLIDFRNTILILTSNAGSRQLKDFSHGIGFTAAGIQGLAGDEKSREYARSIIQKSLSKQFSPEFLNRLDEIITFDQLDQQAIGKIIDIELQGITGRLSEKGISLELSSEAKAFIADKGYDVQFGARPLKRAIQTYVEDLVCDILLGGNTPFLIRIDKEAEADALTCTADGVPALRK